MLIKFHKGLINPKRVTSARFLVVDTIPEYKIDNSFTVRIRFGRSGQSVEEYHFETEEEALQALEDLEKAS